MRERARVIERSGFVRCEPRTALELVRAVRGES